MTRREKAEKKKTERHEAQEEEATSRERPCEGWPPIPEKAPHKSVADSV